jgi:VanZ family protein
MKILVLAVVLVLVLVPFQGVMALTADKTAHFATSAAYGLAAGTGLYKLAERPGPAARIAIASSIALLPGVAVEIIDNYQPGNRFGWGDLLADGIGAVTGAVAAELINGQLWLSASGRQIRLIGHW